MEIVVHYLNFTIDSSEAWSELADSFVPMRHRYRDPETWYSALTAQESSAYALVHWDQRGDRVSLRTPSLVRQSPGDEHYWIMLPLFGSYSAWRGDEQRRATPGSALINRFDQISQIRIPESRSYAFRVPRAEFDHRLAPAAPVHTQLDMTTGLGRVTANLIDSVHEQAEALTDREFNALCDRAAELLCMLALGDMGPQRTHRVEAAAAIRRYVRDRVGESDLCLPAVARALGWSPRQIRLILHEEGITFRDLRQDESLRAARDLLATGEVEIGEVAARTGFTPTWFSAAFKARFGETPREFRKRRLAE
ncbi:AraC family transcriptional regulator [Allokutzneria sp. A3M-2-11 16]|uniref:helix-turn-helix transcriptional regulator n=1 Tax=Allokutzneria sp. A3M-2-11 16 TaxID=2962043 RepID=UPI0020B875DA|nr:AraC family transcriptional regulator [Allokutzneria sp. A3M-2-11 16]MCP3804357.1 AraC family transcriptional regulator [Allokutzneria sp. A3M-2-11 16]